MENKTFVLGVGAQKAGTTWVHSYLSSMDESNFGALKEYHIFDAIYIPECANFRSQIKLKSFSKNLIRRSTNRNYTSRRRFQNNQSEYYDYFESLLKEGNSVYITGDITPSYAGLPSHCYRSINENFEKRDIDVKVVFLLRDPLERCWSTVRMHRRVKKGDLEDVEIRRDEENALKRYFKTSNAEFRTRYNKTIERLESVFDNESIFIGFYETLFQSENREIERLADFLGVPYAEPNLSKRVNASRKNIEISDELKSEIVQHYADVYEFVSNRYGNNFIDGIWKGTDYLIQRRSS